MPQKQQSSKQPLQQSSGEQPEADAFHAASADGVSQRKGTGFFAVMQSVGAAMIGVQSAKNKERDFTHGKPLHFIIGGIVGTLLFLCLIVVLVKYLIATS